MRQILVGLIVLACAGSLSPDPSAAAIRKCGPRTSATLPPMRGLVGDTAIYLMVDGQVRGPLTGKTEYDGAATTYRLTGGTVIIADRDRLSVGIECVVTNDTIRSVVAVVTRDGAVSAVQADLRALALAQEEHRRVTGDYTADLGVLGLFDKRNPVLPIVMAVTNNGWSATVQAGRHVCVAGVGLAGARRGEILCRTAGG